MKKNKGQALIEFVMLLPIIIIILFIIIDFSSIFYNKNHLEGVMTDIIYMEQKDYTRSEIKAALNDESINYTITYNGKTSKLEVVKEVYLLTPFADTFASNPYKVSSTRVFINE